MQVISLKMVSGEEVLARLKYKIESNGALTHYEVESPMTLMAGQRGLALIPWTLSNQDLASIKIPVTHVIVAFEPDEETGKQYLQQTSKIALA